MRRLMYGFASSDDGIVSHFNDFGVVTAPTNGQVLELESRGWGGGETPYILYGTDVPLA